MIKYDCKEINMQGGVIYTKYEADSVAQVIEMIRMKGSTPVKIEAQVKTSPVIGDKSKSTGRAKQFGSKELSIFCRQLSTMIMAGMPLIQCLDVLANQSEKPAMKMVCEELMLDVQKGEILSTAMQKKSKYFPQLIIDMVISGEMTGKLDEVLEKMSIHYTKETKTNSKLKSAMMYPMILGILLVVVVIFMIAFIVPTFVEIFEGFGSKLPAITQLIVDMSDFVKAYWWAIIIVIAGVTILFKSWVATKAGRRQWDGMLLRIPLINVQLKKIYTARYTRTLSTLLASGIPLIGAVESAGRVTQSTVVMEAMDNVIEEIKKGRQLSELLAKVGIFPPMMVSMISIGEESGSLEDMLEKSAEYYDEELDAALTQLMALIEPVMIVAMAVIIGFIVIALLTPMFDMVGAAQGGS